MQDVLARCEELALKFVFGKDETVPPLSVTGAPAAPMPRPLEQPVPSERKPSQHTAPCVDHPVEMHAPCTWSGMQL